MDREYIYPELYPLLEVDTYRDQKVLDYGCGGGIDALRFVRAGATVWGADIVPENVAITTTRAVSVAGIILDASDRIPMPDGFFDIVSANGVLHHIPEPLPVVRELVRVLRDGGRFYAMLYTSLYQIQQLTADHPFTPDGPDCPYVRAYSEREGTELLQDAGLHVADARLFNRGCFRMFRAVK